MRMKSVAKIRIISRITHEIGKRISELIFFFRLMHLYWRLSSSQRGQEGCVWDAYS